MQHISSGRALRGRFITFTGNPFLIPPDEAIKLEEDGLIIIEDGLIKACGDYSSLSATLPPGITVTHYPDCLITAGFVDAHVHYPQLPVIASWGKGLLEWLDDYVFPAERAFSDPVFAQKIASFFLDELLRNGTTTAAVYCTVHPQSVSAFLAESERRGTRMIAGKVMMDRNAPDYLRDDVKRGYDDSLRLIDQWHGRGRQSYAVTPRFAITSTPEQLEAAGALYHSRDGIFMQTHLAETRDEVSFVRSLFPDRSSYLDVYDKAGLVGPRAVFGHAIHLGEDDLCRCHQAGCAFAHCPTSNLFLGSGVFRLYEATAPHRFIPVGLGTDIGAGTSLSLLDTMGEAYKVSLLAGKQGLHPYQALWLATAGGAEALHLSERIGRIAPGMEADLCVLDPMATPLMAMRTKRCTFLHELLFTFMILGDERCVKATWVNGAPVMG